MGARFQVTLVITKIDKQSLVVEYSVGELDVAGAFGEELFDADGDNGHSENLVDIRSLLRLRLEHAVDESSERGGEVGTDGRVVSGHDFESQGLDVAGREGGSPHA